MINCSGGHHLIRGLKYSSWINYIFQLGLGGVLKISSFITYLYRTVLEIYYLFHAEAARNYLFNKYSTPNSMVAPYNKSILLESGKTCKRFVNVECASVMLYLGVSISFISYKYLAFETILVFWWIQHRAHILLKVTVYRRLRIGRDGHLDQSEAYNIP